MSKSEILAAIEEVHKLLRQFTTSMENYSALNHLPPLVPSPPSYTPIDLSLSYSASSPEAVPLPPPPPILSSHSPHSPSSPPSPQPQLQPSPITSVSEASSPLPKLPPPPPPTTLPPSIPPPPIKPPPPDAPPPSLPIVSLYSPPPCSSPPTPSASAATPSSPLPPNPLASSPPPIPHPPDPLPLHSPSHPHANVTNISPLIRSMKMIPPPTSPPTPTPGDQLAPSPPTTTAPPLLPKSVEIDDAATMGDISSPQSVLLLMGSKYDDPTFIVGNGYFLGDTGEPPPSLPIMLSNIRARVSVGKICESQNWALSKDLKSNLIVKLGPNTSGPNCVILAAQSAYPLPCQLLQFHKISFLPPHQAVSPLLPMTHLSFQRLRPDEIKEKRDRGFGNHFVFLVGSEDEIVLGIECPQQLSAVTRSYAEQSMDFYCYGSKVQLCGEPPPKTSPLRFSFVYFVQFWAGTFIEQLVGVTFSPY